jgi:hypothetical protein
MTQTPYLGQTGVFGVYSIDLAEFAGMEQRRMPGGRLALSQTAQPQFI